jgi:hypothetical protein
LLGIEVDDCEECFERHIPWMIGEMVDCDEAPDCLVFSKCNKSQSWSKEEFCLETFVRHGLDCAYIV